MTACLRIQKFRSRRPGSGTKSGRTCSRNSVFCAAVSQESLGRRCNYSGLSPSASNCRLHSVGGSRSRSMPMPRGRRPSTAALTRLGARKASEMIILTCRTLQFSRVQSSATVVTRPETTSSSHRRPRAIALTRRARRSNCSGRTSLREVGAGRRGCRMHGERQLQARAVHRRGSGDSPLVARGSFTVLGKAT